MSGIASEHLICLIQNRPAAWTKPTTPTDSGPFSAESSFRYTQGFASGAKNDTTALVVLRTMLRKNTTTFAKLQNGKFGLRAWYPHLKAPKEGSSSGKGADDADDSETEDKAEAKNADAA